MAVILNLETATTNCSVGLAIDGQLIDHQARNEGYTHAEKLAVFIQEMLQKHQVELDAIAVSKGPGSYTGLRIGVSTAKGLCYALEKPLIAIHTLQAMTQQAVAITPNVEQLYCPMIDARRMEVYTALLDKNLAFVRPVSAEIIEKGAFSNVLNEQPIVFFGNGSDKCKTLLEGHPNASFLANLHPSAEGMAALAEAAFQENRFEDVAYFEPFYLKEFMATVPKKLI